MSALASETILAESSTLALFGVFAGGVVHTAIVLGASVIVREQTGVVLSLAHYHPALWAVPCGVVVLGALAGLIPARSAYATDVATNLAGT